MIRYKENILTKLKERGYNTSRLRKEKIIGESTMQLIRTQGEIPYKTLNFLCSTLECGIEDIIEYIPDPEDQSEVRDS